MSPLDQRWENFGAHSLFFFFLSKIVHLLIEICPLARAGDTPLKAGIPFRGASPTLLTPPGKFKGELCGHLKTMSPLDQRWENFGAHSLFFFFLSKIVHLLIEIDRERSSFHLGKEARNDSSSKCIKNPRAGCCTVPDLPTHLAVLLPLLS